MSDYADIARIQRDLMAVATEIEALAPQVAQARTVKDYDGDRKKVLLSVGVSPLLATESASSAEHQARASAPYIQGMKDLRGEYLVALTVIAKNDAIQCKFEALRSVLAVARASMNL